MHTFSEHEVYDARSSQFEMGDTKLSKLRGNSGSTASVCAAEDAICETGAGWLSKQGHLVKNWKRRYFRREVRTEPGGGETEDLGKPITCGSNFVMVAVTWKCDGGITEHHPPDPLPSPPLHQSTS